MEIIGYTNSQEDLLKFLEVLNYDKKFLFYMYGHLHVDIYQLEDAMMESFQESIRLHKQIGSRTK